MYPSFAQKAREEGFDDIAKILKPSPWLKSSMKSATWIPGQR